MRLLAFKNSSVFDSVRVVDFHDFKRLNLYDTNFNRYKFSSLAGNFVFLPTRKLILDISFDTFLLQTFFRTKYIFFTFIFLTGFDVGTFEIGPYLARINIFNSRLASFKHDLLLDDIRVCHDGTHFNQSSYFHQMFNINFDMGTRYSTETCKFLFKNASVDTVSFYDLTRSFVKKNQLGFVPRFGLNGSLGCYIQNAQFCVYSVRIGAQLLDEDVFKITEQLIFRGDVGDIEREAFARLKYVKLVALFISNIRMIFSRGIDWINFINEDVAIDVTNETQLILGLTETYTTVQTYRVESLFPNNKLDLEKPYSYPDEDFCLFVKFPFQRLVFLDPQTICVNFNCSCTQHWLLQYVHYVTLANVTLNIYGSFNVTGKKYQLEMNKCHFKQV